MDWAFEFKLRGRLLFARVEVKLGIRQIFVYGSEYERATANPSSSIGFYPAEEEQTCSSTRHWIRFWEMGTKLFAAVIKSFSSAEHELTTYIKFEIWSLEFKYSLRRDPSLAQQHNCGGMQRYPLSGSIMRLKQAEERQSGGRENILWV